MKIKVLKASDWNYEEIKEVNTIADLKAIDNNIIIDFDPDEDINNGIDATVTIYDDYVE